MHTVVEKKEHESKQPTALNYERNRNIFFDGAKNANIFTMLHTQTHILVLS